MNIKNIKEVKKVTKTLMILLLGSTLSQAQDYLSNESRYEPVKVAIIDSHFDYQSNTKDVLTQDTVQAVQGKEKKYLAQDAHKYGKDHANHVASIVHECAKNAQLRVIDQYNEPSLRDINHHNRTLKTRVNDARLIWGIHEAIKSNVDFINISLRISPDAGWHKNDTISVEVQEAFLRAKRAGIGIIKSAGNDGEFTGSTAYTRSLDKLLRKMDGSMIIVAALDKDKTRLASFSNKAGISYPFTVAAPGTKILAYGAQNIEIEKNGTSMAAPYVTGLAASVKQAYPKLSSREILSLIRSSAQKENSESLEKIYGCGIVTPCAAHVKARQLSIAQFSASEK